MRKSLLLITISLLALLLAFNQWSEEGVFLKSYFGGLPWYGWASISAFLFVTGIGFAWSDAAVARYLLTRPAKPTPDDEVDLTIQISPEDLERLDPNGPDYPHPVIFPERCIGCHACVDACPHDVLSMVNNIATPVAPDQCLEDTACQLECPVNPKACIVVNTTKKIKPRPVPLRNEKFMAEGVAGCYIVGDVSGTPLIKNAANEGADVVKHIAQQLGKQIPDDDAPAPSGNGAQRAQGNGQQNGPLDVAIIGIGPAGLSAAIMAQRCGLSYVGIEQNKVLATIDAYPKGKYVFLKPETMEWRGAIDVPGLHEERDQVVDEALGEILSDASESDSDVLVRHASAVRRIIEALFKRADKLVPEQRDQMLVSICEIIIEKLCEKLPDVERVKSGDAAAVSAPAAGGEAADVPIEQRKIITVELLERCVAPLRGQLGEGERGALIVEVRERVLAEMRKKIAGEQREEMLDTWLNNMRRNHVHINEGESCQAVKRQGDHFTIETKKGKEQVPATYTARNVIIAVGNLGSPMRLGVKGEDLQITRDGATGSKVLYKLTDPEEYKRRRVIVVGGGNSAIEAAVDLVARRSGDEITFRPDNEINDVTLVVRSDFKNDLKFGNKLQIYRCIDEGKLSVRFGEAIKEIRDGEVVLMDARTKEEKITLPNDYILALIGGDKPTKFLKSIGIIIPDEEQGKKR